MTADRDALIAQVRTLQEKWRADAERHKKHGDCYRIGEGWALEGCADDLDTLLSLLDGPRRQEPEQKK